MGLLLPAVLIYFCPSRRTASIAQDSISGDQMWLGGNSYGPQLPGVLGGFTKHYTTTLQKEDQEWLIEHHPKRYWDGLPPFVQEFLRTKVVAAHQVGKLDDMPNEILRLYLSGQMTVGYCRGKGFQR